MLYELYILLFLIRNINRLCKRFIPRRKKIAKSTFMYNHSSFTSYFNDSHFL